ncbi:hypothetical protein Rhe02_02240 [Rhizocola hellebori]|uniref:Secreted protein n=2 Tax=Rhizocola hellebori TaxID=1392758 RepID=A0A8J3VD47_9ACTN|nr:hypothetical protein Rhe02_02240 [Rhizocola hellebori]
MRRRLAALSAAVLLATSGTLIAASPAQAGKEGCVYQAGHYEQAGGYITGYRLWACVNGNDILLPVSVEHNLSPGVYETVASGEGWATFYCSGTLFGFYRAGSPGDFGIHCS